VVQLGRGANEQAAVGADGMGQVYRAVDTRLDRFVAIKILPEAFATDPQFRERFDRETVILNWQAELFAAKT
jgi:serine/threonine protein kinase